MDNKKIIQDIFFASLKAVDPYKSVRAVKDTLLGKYSEGNYKKVVVIGFGKAACPMAKAAEELLPVDDGIVITKYGHCADNFKPEKIRVSEAGHPVPDKNGLRAANELSGLVRDLDRDVFVVCLVSGGGSALLASPIKGITLDEKRIVTELLLKAGADIYELNTVRKHISGVKGGRLAQILYPSRVVSLLLSDVMGDKLDVIASGPTVPDSSTYRDAMNVIQKYALSEKIPVNVLKIIEKGIEGQIPETPKKGEGVFENVDNIIVGSNRIALEAARDKAESLSMSAEILSSDLAGEAREAGLWLAEKALEVRNSKPHKKICLISGGETTVTVRGSGTGGRNTELALAAAIALDGEKAITLLSAGTDGTDGPTDAAGAVIDGESIQKAGKLGLDAEEYLGNNDSYPFFKATGDLLITGPTGTNVMDVQVILVH